MKEVKCYVKEPGQRYGISTRLPDTLDDYQRTVGGSIETVTFGGRVVVISDDEGKLKGYRYNCNLNGVNFVGTIIAVGADGEGFGDVPIGWDVWKRWIDFFN